jgi:hypothetical protein
VAGLVLLLVSLVLLMLAIEMSYRRGYREATLKRDDQGSLNGAALLGLLSLFTLALIPTLGMSW